MKLIKLLMLSVILFSTYPLQCVARSDAPNPVFSFADPSCGAWSSSQNNVAQRDIYLFWIRGYVSGYNHGSEQYVIPLEIMPSNDTMILFVDKFCREHPLMDFTSSALFLLKEIKTKIVKNAK